MAQKNFEDAMMKLEDIVERLEQGELSLEKSLKAFEDGMRLANFCSKKLEEAEQRVTKLISHSDGSVHKEPFDTTEAED